MEYWIVYDKESGAILMRGSGPPGTLQLQRLSEAQGVIPVPLAALEGIEVNLDVVRSHLASQIDGQAEALRQLFITPGYGQALEYQEAVAQANACLADASGDYPMLQADVFAGTIDPRSGLPVTTQSEAASLVLFMFAQWNTAGAAIRAARLRAKVSIATATNIAAIHDASIVDWSAVTIN